MASDSKNPFQSPDSTPEIRSNREPVVRFSFRAAFFVLLCGIAGSGIGGLFGLVIATIVPDYYRSVTAFGRRPDFDPVSFGFGQGVTQGLVGGVCVGLVLVALTWFFKYRSERVVTKAGFDDPTDQKNFPAGQAGQVEQSGQG